jgi:hypothetical protein
MKVLSDEIEWISEETRLIDRILPFLSKKLLLKTALLMAGIFLLTKFFELFITIVFIALISYIRFKRTKRGINIEIEPSYLFAIVLTIAFGLNYGLALIIIPGLAAIAVSGLSGSIVINIANKIAVILGVYVFWLYFRNTALIVAVAISLVILTDILTLRVRQKVGQPMHEIIQVIASNAIVRLAYFSILLEPIARIISSIG